MQLSHIFAPPPSQQWQQRNQHGPTRFEAEKRKRKRLVVDDVDDDDESVDEHTNKEKSPRKTENESDRYQNQDEDESDTQSETLDRTENTPRAAPSLALTANQVEQYRVAGLSLDQRIPPRPFPAAAYPFKKTNARLEAKKELAALNPPLYLHPHHFHGRFLEHEEHEKQLGILNTMLHRLLLRGDFQRAGRAWALLLRSSYAGVELRTQGKWAIGAELLLRKASQILLSEQPSEDDKEEEEEEEEEEAESIDSELFSRVVFSEEGFEATKTYYERLILQHPYNRLPNSTASNFYPALFSVWIYQAAQNSHSARLAAEKQFRDADDDDDDDDDERMEDIDRSRSATLSSSLQPEEGSFRGRRRGASSKHQARLMSIKARERTAADDIADRLDRVVSAPPHDRNAELFGLAGMVALWRRDLVFIDDRDDHDDHDDGTGNTQNAQKEKYLRDAARMFWKCQKLEGKVWEGALLEVEHLFQEFENEGDQHQSSPDEEADLGHTSEMEMSDSP